MRARYVYDEKGRKTGVIIPVELWEELKDKIEVKVKEEIFNPSEYKGIYKDLGVDLEEEIRDLREEWTRDT